MFGIEGLTINLFVVEIIAMIFISGIFAIFGRGGGEFKLPVLITCLTMLPFQINAGISQFAIFLQACGMLLIYGHKHKSVDWPLAFSLAGIVAVFAFSGAYLSFDIKSIYLKGTFAVLLMISAYFMWKGKGVPGKPGKFGVWHRKMTVGGETIEFDMNFLLIVIPVAFIAFIAGAVGISGCGLIIPVCIILGAVPIRIAIGSNTVLLLTSTGTAFLGRLLKADMPWTLTIICGIAALCGALIGANLHMNIPEKQIKAGFITILIIASVWMIMKMYIY